MAEARHVCERGEGEVETGCLTEEGILIQNPEEMAEATAARTRLGKLGVRF